MDHAPAKLFRRGARVVVDDAPHGGFDIRELPRARALLHDKLSRLASHSQERLQSCAVAPDAFCQKMAGSQLLAGTGGQHPRNLVAFGISNELVIVDDCKQAG